MSKTIEHVDTLYRNPFLLAPVFIEFYSYSEWKPHNMLLAYLVLPLVLYPESQRFLRNANRRSRIRTMLNEKSRIYGLVQRIDEFRRVSNESIQYAMDCGDLILGKGMSLERGEVSLKPILSELNKPARSLAKLFNPYDVPTVYRMLGVKEI